MNKQKIKIELHHYPDGGTEVYGPPLSKDESVLLSSAFMRLAMAMGATNQDFTTIIDSMLPARPAGEVK